MPDIERTADVKVSAGGEPATLRFRSPGMQASTGWSSFA